MAQIAAGRMPVQQSRDEAGKTPLPLHMAWRLTELSTVKDQYSNMAVGIAVGVGVGAVIGAALENIPIGIAIGIAIGGAAGAFLAPRGGK
jgi:hypothetical protein